MKPKPLVALNHLTVPVVITNPFIATINLPPGDARRLFRLLRGKVDQEAQSAAKTNNGKQSIDGALYP
jgi:hypothetical protein